MKIGTGIREVRKTMGISQGSLCDMAGLSQTSLSQIENNVTRPSQRTINKISDALEVPEQIFYLLSIDESDVAKGKKKLYESIYPSIVEMVKKLII